MRSAIVLALFAAGSVIAAPVPTANAAPSLLTRTLEFAKRQSGTCAVFPNSWGCPGANNPQGWDIDNSGTSTGSTAMGDTTGMDTTGMDSTDPCSHSAFSNGGTASADSTATNDGSGQQCGGSSSG